MRILYRILAAPLVAVLLLGIAGGTAYWSIKHISAEFEVLHRENGAAKSLGDIKTRMAALKGHLYRTMILIEGLDEKQVQAARDHIKVESAWIRESLGTLRTSGNPELAAKRERLPELADTYTQKALQALDTAEASPGAGAMLLGPAEKAFVEAFGILNEVADSAEQDAQTMVGKVSELSAMTSSLLMGLTLVAVAASAAIAFVISRSVVSKLEHALQISESMSRGELAHIPSVQGEDEISRLLQSLATTNQRLSESLRSIADASNAIDSAAAEISMGSNDLSIRTEHTAASVQESSSAISEVGRLFVEGESAAATARKMVSTANELAQLGGGVVSQVVNTMDDINSSSSRIVEITSVIDGIAFQTNILALNAAVEAARAGEHGRGFAVVASEVRALAQRSATAAKEIKSIIASSVDCVQHGAALVGQAGETMRKVVESVANVEHSISLLSHLAEQQRTSVDGVSETVARFDQSVQENAALAEQSAAASMSLRSQASSLSSVVSRFKFV